MELNIKWITGDQKMGVDMIDWANHFGQQLHNDALSVSQIRKFFGEVRRIELDWSNKQGDVPMLLAKLAYAVGRAEKKKKYGIKNFTDTFTPAIREASKSEENFNRFTKILEATVAYHKYHGGAE